MADQSNLSSTWMLIRRRYLDLLEADRSLLLADPETVNQLLRQLDSVVDATFQALNLSAGGAWPRADESSLVISAEIGQSRASSGIHPAHSLHAASRIFEAALPAVVETLQQCGREDCEREAGLALNRAILDRMAVAAEFYVAFLLDKMHNSNLDERRRISRELHDVVAPSIVLGLQNLELHDAYGDSDRNHAEDKIQNARRAINEAMSAVRALAAESRESLSRNGLRYAINHALSRAPAEVKTRLDVRGDDDRLLAPYREEACLIIQEAVRNAFAHARPSLVNVSLDVDSVELTASIHDDGSGFDPATAGCEKNSLGLTSMRERATLLGGVLRVDSKIGEGTTVKLFVPLLPCVTPASLSAVRPT